MKKSHKHNENPHWFILDIIYFSLDYREYESGGNNYFKNPRIPTQNLPVLAFVARLCTFHYSSESPRTGPQKRGVSKESRTPKFTYRTVSTANFFRYDGSRHCVTSKFNFPTSQTFQSLNIYVIHYGGLPGLAPGDGGAGTDSNLQVWFLSDDFVKTETSRGSLFWFYSARKWSIISWMNIIFSNQKKKGYPFIFI